MSELASSIGQKAAKHSFNAVPTSTHNSLTSHNRAKTVQRTPRPRIGQLLLEAGIIKSDNLHQALSLAKEAKQPVGRLLVGLGYLSERDLQTALLVQSLIAEGAVTEGAAIRAIKESSKRQSDVALILKEMEDQVPDNQNDSGLGELLVASGIITQQMHDECRDRSMVSGLLLGRMLLLVQGITAPMLHTALTILVMQRDGHLTCEQSVKLLREIRRSNCSIEGALANCRIKLVSSVNAPKIGELLSMSKFISETESAIAVERSLHEKKLVGEIMVRCGAVSECLLKDALVLQSFVSSGVATINQASDILQHAYAEGKTINQVAEEMQVFSSQTADEQRALKLLKTAGLISDIFVSTAVMDQQKFHMSPCRALLASGHLQAATFNCAMQLIKMLDANKIREEQAVMAIGVCERSRVDLSSALASMGIATAQATAPFTAQPDKENRFATLKDWVSYTQFQQIVALLVITLGACLSVDKFAHGYLFPVMWVSAALLGAGFLKLGFSMRADRDHRDLAQQLHLTSALQTKARLEQRPR